MRARSLLGISTLPRDSPIFIGPRDFAALSITSRSLRLRGNAAGYYLQVYCTVDRDAIGGDSV